MKAFVVNRFGDIGFLAGLLLLFWGLGGGWTPREGPRTTDYLPTAGLQATAGATNAAQSDALAPRVDGVKVGPTMNFRELRDQVVIDGTGVKEGLLHKKIWGVSLLALIGILLFVGAMGKSAQLPLYVWLPDAMAGPTPVSALIHAATMVTAGVYMVARLNFLFALSPSAMGWVALIGALTAFFAASIGFFQYDIKKVLAYSTVSQLGFMFIGVGIGSYWAGAYHLLTHAFFKATLFLGSGSVILGCHHEQDMRKMGGLKKYMPITRYTYLYACIAIAGFPIANGFYSKDEILWKAFTSRHLELFGTPTPWLGPVIYLLGIVAATGTAFYMYRSYYMTFTGEYRGGEGHHDEHNEDPHSATATAMSHTSVAVHASDGAVHAAGHGHAAPAHGAHAAPAHAAAAHATAHDDDAARSRRAPRREAARVALDDHLRPLGARHRLGPHPLPRHPDGLDRPRADPRALARPRAPRAGGGPVHHDRRRPPEPPARAPVPGHRGRGRVHRLARGPRPLQGREEHRPRDAQGALRGVLDGRLQQVLRGRALRVHRHQALALGRAHVQPLRRHASSTAIVNFVGAIGRFLGRIDAAIDTYLVDGAVNAIAAGTIGFGRSLRGIQTGRIQTYLYGALGGALVVVLLNFLIQ